MKRKRKIDEGREEEREGNIVIYKGRKREK